MKKAIFILFLTSVLISCGKETKPNKNFSYFKLPKLVKLNPEKTYKLRLLRVVDKRLRDLNKTQYARLYKEIEKTAKDYIGFNVKIVPVGKVEILSFFEKYKTFLNTKAAKTEILSDFIDVRKDNWKTLVKDTIEKIVKHYGAKINRYIPIQYRGSVNKIVNYLYPRFIDKYTQIKNIRVKNRDKFFNNKYIYTQSYVHWDIILHHIKNADIILTNTMIACPDKGMPIYVINRGGITSGFVEDNLHNYPLSGASMVGLFQFISQAEFFKKYRGNIPSSKLLKVISMMAGHELGHLLLRYKEKYVPEAGIHMTAKDLHYYKWYKRVLSMKNKHPIKNVKTLKNF